MKITAQDQKGMELKNEIQILSRVNSEEDSPPHLLVVGLMSKIGDAFAQMASLCRNASLIFSQYEATFAKLTEEASQRDPEDDRKRKKRRKDPNAPKYVIAF